MAYKDTLTNTLETIQGLNTQTLDLQQKAAKAFNALGIPTTKNEEWKFTNLNKVFGKDFSASNVILANKNTTLSDFEQYRVSLENGVVNKSSSEFISNNELEISDLSDKLKDAYFVKETFNKAFASDQESMIQLNTALLQGGVFVKVAKGKTIEKPIVIAQTLGADDTLVAAYSRIIVDIEENAEATVVLFSESIGSLATLSNQASEIHVAKNARLKLYILQNDHSEASQINNTKIIQENSSVIDVVTISLDGDLIRNNLNIILNDEHIESNFSSLYLIKGKTHVDNHTVADHKFPNCNSNELYKGIMDERARGVFNGKIFVRKDAQKTNAFQANNNILLSDDAIINTKPQLEIWADDVKCSHGCTVGQMDKEALFYLQTRGIGEQKAKALILESFALEVVEKITFEPIANYITGLISSRFGNE
jgi:Fe-S cluster assembly protein SufD